MLDAQRAMPKVECPREDDYGAMRGRDWESQQRTRNDNPGNKHCLALYLDCDACECLPGASPAFPEAEQWWLPEEGNQCPFNPFRDPRPGDPAPVMHVLRRNRRRVDLIERSGGLLRWVKRLRDLHRCGRLPDPLSERDFIILNAVLDWIDSPPRDKPDKKKRHAPDDPRPAMRPRVSPMTVKR